MYLRRLLWTLSKTVSGQIKYLNSGMAWQPPPPQTKQNKIWTTMNQTIKSHLLFFWETSAVNFDLGMLFHSSDSSLSRYLSLHSPHDASSVEHAGSPPSCPYWCAAVQLQWPHLHMVTPTYFPRCSPEGKAHHPSSGSHCVLHLCVLVALLHHMQKRPKCNPMRTPNTEFSAQRQHTRSTW